MRIKVHITKVFAIGADITIMKSELSIGASLLFIHFELFINLWIRKNK